MMTIQYEQTDLLEQRRWQCQNVSEVTCNLCGSEEATFITKENNLPIVECNHCQLIYVNPRPTDEELRKFL